ncbi:MULTISPECIES: histidine kinase [unclassified Microbacterium]|uniref:sensor histidine kinase n=1 Tax=unclassified Microbacterium TaxID=2609290 RepID=UPI00214B8F1C|nr:MULTISPECIES: histidine kinase [unclassified Microbacterium]MCR2783793.1 histidine kinase [Microbacterium sp. zg.B96]WIM15355.1 histidine kinase [Microbacterium sp. zg-B96]
MVNRRGWDIAILGAGIIVAVFAVLIYNEGTPGEQAVSIGSVAAVVLAYLLLARHEIGEDPPTWRVPVFIVAVSVAVGIGVSVNPFLAMLQTIIYPLVWMITANNRQAIVGSALPALTILVGFAAGEDFSAGGWASGLVTAGFSLLFAVVFGLWIASIADSAEERGRLLAELTSAQDAVQALSRDRGAAQERERMAREIHDTLAQTLAGLVLIAERAGGQYRSGKADAAMQSIATVEAVAREALAEARALVARTAAVPAEAAFDAALERLVERFRAEAGLQIDLDSALDADVDRDAQVVMLRCVQEALANVRKHADAARASVRVAAMDGTVVLEVIDDGRGFDPLAPRSGFGLDGMAERIALAGGALDIQARPGGGAALRVTLPTSNAAQPAVEPA